MRIFNNAAALAAGLALTACVSTAYDQSGSENSLSGEEWVVEDIADRGVIDYARTTINFGQDGRISGDTACNRYFADYRTDGPELQIEKAGVTKRACAEAMMDQETRFLNVFNAVDSYQIDATGALILSTPNGTTITARRIQDAMPKTSYRCTDGSVVEAWYPTSDTAKISYKGQTVDMVSAVSASGARYVGGGLQWWTKGMTEGMLAPLAQGENIASARGVDCTAG